MHRLIRAGLAGAALLVLAPAAKAADSAAPKSEIQKPRSNWQTPGEIQQPRGNWQTPGAIQVPKGIQAIHSEAEKCTQRFLVGSDALFEFDKSTLSADAEETLKALVPLLAKAGKPGERGRTHRLEGSRGLQPDPERETGADRRGLARRARRSTGFDADQRLGKTQTRGIEHQARWLGRSGGAAEKSAGGSGAGSLQEERIETCHPFRREPEGVRAARSARQTTRLP